MRRFNGEDQSNRIFSFSVVGHYNFLRGMKASPFIGLGLGTGSCNVVKGYKDNEGATFVVSSRIGIELFYYLTADQKSYAIVEGATLSNGIELTVVTYVSYNSVSSSRQTLNESVNDGVVELQDNIIMPSVNVGIDKLQRLLLEKTWMSAKVRMSSWPEMGVKP